MNTNQSELFSSYSKDIVREFLQTVTVVDDKAYYNNTQKLLAKPRVKKITNKPGLRDVADAAETVEVAASILDEALQMEGESELIDEHVLDAKKIIDKFSQSGIACAVISPVDENEIDLQKNVLSISSKSDIAVFDWVLGKDQAGDTVTSIIMKMVVDAVLSEPRLRLIAVYTGEDNLGIIFDKLKKEVEKNLLDNNCKIPVEVSVPYSIKVNSVKICLFVKKRLETEDETLERDNRILSEDELPERLIEEFTEMTSGLVSNVALKSMTIIRSHMHAILSKFNKTVDPAFLSHRIMLPIPDDANKLLETLIGAEIGTLLEENKVGEVANTGTIKKWLLEHPEIQKQFNEEGGTFEIEQMGEVFDLGLPNIGNQITDNVTSEYKDFIEKMGFKAKQLKDKPHTLGLTKRFLGINPGDSDESANIADFDFAILTTIKTLRKKEPPQLYFGSLLKSIECIQTTTPAVPVIEGQSGTPTQIQDPIFTEKSEYWVCIQPPCDCVRLEQKREFLFLPLERIQGDGKFDLILKDSSEYIKVRVKYNPYSLKKKSFEPDSTKQQILTNDKNTFKCEDGTELKWLGELKFPHIQRIVNKFAEQLSRVGLDESEWLRLSATK